MYKSVTAYKRILAMVLYFGFLLVVNPSITSGSESEKLITFETDVPIPKTLSLCGEPMPLDNPWVWEMLDRELTITIWNESQIFMWIKRSGRYFPFIEEKLRQEGLPEDLKYLAVAESALIPNIKSSRGAMGIWQFMMPKAKEIGLRCDERVDERRDLEQSTHAALAYLRNLKENFGTWALAMAAYNCGEDRLKKEMREQQQTDYYTLNLPEETERYIFRIAAVKLIIQNPESYGYRVPEEKMYKPISCDEVKVSLDTPIHLADFSKNLGTYPKEIKDLNPKIIGYYLPTGTYMLKIPSGTGSKVPKVLRNLSVKATSQPVETYQNIYIVKRGETLSEISKKTGISVSQIQKLNNIKGSLIKPGQRLKLE